VTNLFDLHFSFTEAYIPGVLNWENPWSHPSNSLRDKWAVTNFTSSTLTDNYLGFYDPTNEVAFALKFEEQPDWGNVGALPSMQIDAVRFQYNYDKININQTESFAYQVLAFWKNSFPQMHNLSDLKSLFDFKPASTFEVASRDYHDYIKQNNIGFIVYDKNQLDTKLILAKILELVYSNDRYAVFKVNSET
jgi:hypothetical protein